jgi:lysophospholipase L1-like esterase
MSDFAWQAGQTIVMTGDSITDCGRFEDPQALGYGYVRQTVGLVRARYPERHLHILNTGIGGNCVDDLQGRWQADVLDHQPDWVTIMIGINDLHRTKDGIKELPPTAFEDGYRDILDQTRALGARLVLIDPFFMALAADGDAYRAEVLDRLPGYLAVVAKLAAEFEAIHVRTQEAWRRVLATYPASGWCDEPVHPNNDGHFVMASALLAALGF